jgi:hypothetical protein
MSQQSLLAAIPWDLGFADQLHMIRSVDNSLAWRRPRAAKSQLDTRRKVELPYRT